MPPSLAVRIRKARTDRNMRQVDLAKAVEASQATVCRWERGGAEPSWPLRARLAEVLDMPDLVAT